MSPKHLNQQTYFEIFNSKKESLKKPINFINYSNLNHDLISNDQMPDNLNVYMSKRVDYDSSIPQYKNAH